jgi:hypothetical protein
MTAWFEAPSNIGIIQRLRGTIGGQGRLLVFVGAGMSFAASRLNGRAKFDYERYDRPWLHDLPYGDLSPDDDGLPLPSWTWLVNRMCRRLSVEAHPSELEALRAFFIEEGPLDCAQLFRQRVGEANYREFLVEQFDCGRHAFVRPTPSHGALVQLQLPLVFSTNYDELIETAHLEAGTQLRVSISEQEFKAHRSRQPGRHLVKLHGSINQPDTIVLTRTDYAKARIERKEMLGHLRSASSYVRSPTPSRARSLGSPSSSACIPRPCGTGSVRPRSMAVPGPGPRPATLSVWLSSSVRTASCVGQTRS